MPEINVNTSNMRISALKLYLNSLKLSGYVATLDAIRGTLPFSDEVAHEIDKALRINCEQISESKSRLNRMSNAINDIADSYEHLEAIRSISVFGWITNDSRFRYVVGPGGQLQDIPDGLWSAAVGGSVVAGSVLGSCSILGLDLNGTASGSLLNYSADASLTSGLKMDEDGNIDRLGVVLEGNAGANLAEGELSGTVGNLSGSLSGTVGEVGAQGELGATLFSDGRFAPSLYGSLVATGSVLSGTANVSWSDDYYTLSGTASGDLLTAKAGIEGGAGYITIEDEAGNISTAWGVKGEVGAEAYVVKGTLSGGFEIFGVEFNANVTGGAGGAGVKAGGHATTGGVSGELGLGLGVGGNVSFSVDWSEFDGGAVVDAIGEAAENVGEFVEDTGEFLGNAGEVVSDFFGKLF